MDVRKTVLTAAVASSVLFLGAFGFVQAQGPGPGGQGGPQQEGGFRRGGGGPGGQGGPGGPRGMHGGPPGPEHMVQMLAHRLNLSEGQVQKVMAIAQETRKKMEALHEEQNSKIRSVLNDEQKAQFDEMEKHRKEMREQGGRRGFREGGEGRRGRRGPGGGPGGQGGPGGDGGPSALSLDSGDNCPTPDFE